MQPVLDKDIKFLPGVGPKRAELLEKELGIQTFRDLLYHFPYRYEDRTKFYKVNEIHPDLPYIQVKGKIKGFREVGDRYRKRLTAIFYDETGSVELVWFKGLNWIKENFMPGTTYYLHGKPSIFKGAINIVHPEMEEVSKASAGISSGLQAFYNTTEKMKNNFITSRVIHKFQQKLLAQMKDRIPESLPGYLVKEHKLLSLNQSLVNIHFPANADLLSKARFRLKFEELFYLQLNILKTKINRNQKSQGFVFEKVGGHFNRFYHEKLPFDLTAAQKKVMKEIRRDLLSGKQMNRLLQGDVGSGKTMVALMSMLIALDNQFQACLMAPTEILANQHFATISGMLEGLDINTRVLTGSTRKKQREIIHDELINGKLQILVGTHALIEDTVRFGNLGLVVIDEQHRFGVVQRAKLWRKNIQPPHVLVMTATPIPRTLAMTVYGDLEVSVIDELPPGRKPIKTTHYFDNKRLPMFGFLRNQIEQGRQIYIVYPLIKESEKMDYKDLEDGYASISRAFPPPEYAVSILHGKMKAGEKETAMKYFVEGKTHIMVATTVIEVGVDVPNASVMVIESAEKFGLSQLHQLRGRVGRGADQSYCVLMSSHKLTREARARIETMVRTNDGFEIAEADLKLRGPGDLEGTQQSGIPFDLKIASLGHDSQILHFSRNVANDILDDDPLLVKQENGILKRELKRVARNKIDWSIIS
jgi:ATP-dependent DNA helicase RecG